MIDSISASISALVVIGLFVLFVVFAIVFIRFLWKKGNSSNKVTDDEITKWMDHREQLIALHLALYLKGEQHREFGPSIQKVLDDFHVKEAVDAYNSSAETRIEG